MLGISVASEILNINKDATISLTMVDVSRDAMDVALINGKKILPNMQVKYVIEDIFNASFHGTYDVILSNPPYIKTHDIGNLENQVRDFEPYIALDGGYDGLKFYKRLSQICKTIMHHESILCLEIGIHQDVDVIDLFNEYHLMSIAKDIAGINRCLLFKLKQ